MTIKTLLFTASLLALSTVSARAQCSAPNIASLPVTVSASGSTLIIPVTAGRSIHLCVLSVSFASAVGVTLQSTTSGGSNSNLSGQFQLTVNNLSLNLNLDGATSSGLGNGISLNLSSAVSGGGIVTYYSTPN